MTITRRGLYGTIHIPWSSGFPPGANPEMYSEGQITPPSGSVTIQHGIQSKNFTISVSWCSHDRFKKIKLAWILDLFKIFLYYFLVYSFSIFKKNPKHGFPYRLLPFSIEQSCLLFIWQKRPLQQPEEGPDCRLLTLSSDWNLMELSDLLPTPLTHKVCRKWKAR